MKTLGAAADTGDAAPIALPPDPNAAPPAPADRDLTFPFACAIHAP